MLLLTHKFLALTVLFFSFQSHAECFSNGEKIEFKGNLSLTSGTTVVCDKAELFISEGARIITNGFKFVLQADDATLVIPKSGFSILCSVRDLPGDVRSGCGDVEIHAQNITGGKIYGSGTDFLMDALSYPNLAKPEFDTAAAGFGHEGSVRVLLNANESSLAAISAKM